MKCVLVIFFLCLSFNLEQLSAQDLAIRNREEHIDLEEQNAENLNAERRFLDNQGFPNSNGLQPGVPGVPISSGVPVTSANVAFFTQIVCYSCTDCTNVYPNTTRKTCPPSIYNSKQKCVKYVEQYQHMKKPWTVRGCASELGACQEVSRAHDMHADTVKLLYCGECDGDSCNGVSRSLPGAAMAFFVFIITPALAKYTLL